jgi:hypothetical protein
MRQRAILLLVYFLTACGGGGGGGDGSSSGNPPGAPPAADQAMGGIWFGTSTNSLEPGVVNGVFALSTDDGEFRFITGQGIQAVGSFAVSGTHFSGTSIDTAPSGSVLANGQVSTTSTYSGTITEHESVEGAWSSATGESGDFVLTYDDRHATASSLATVTGTYTSFDESDLPYGTITVDPSGNITGSDTAGCVYGGSVQIIDPRYNMYRVNVTIANCGELDGSYSGLGAYDSVDASFAYQIDNTQFIVSDEIFR